MTRAAAVQLARLAAEREAVAVRIRLGRSAVGLSGIATAASWLGVLLTVRLIIGSFPALIGDKWTALWRLEYSLGRALIPTVWGIAVAIVGFVAHQWVNSAVNGLAQEMRIAILELELALTRLK